MTDVKATFGEEDPPLILDAGCGVGVVTRLIYSKGFSVVGVDINEAALRLHENQSQSGRSYLKTFLRVVSI